MFGFANFLLAEFWKLWAMLALTTAIGVLALAVFWLVPSLTIKRIALHVAIAAFAFTFVFGFGAKSRDNLCQAQITAAQERFEKLETDIKAAAEAERKRLEGELSQRESLIDKWSRDYATLLANSKDVPCLLTDDDIRRMQ